MKCPKCQTECCRDEVDVGPGVIHGPYGCPGCGWSESPRYDRSEGSGSMRADGGTIDQYGGYHPPAMDAEIEQIKTRHFEALRGRRVVLLIQGDYGYDVQQWSPGGVAPTSSYDTAQEAAARACQLLGLEEPVTPQNWPEIAQIGPGNGPPPKPSNGIKSTAEK